MRRRRWAPLAAAACLVALTVLLAAAVDGGGAPCAPMPAPRRSGAARLAAFDAAVASASVARCRKQANRAGAACAGLPGGGGGDDDDDKRVVPTGSNPLHNR